MFNIYHSLTLLVLLIDVFTNEVSNAYLSDDFCACNRIILVKKVKIGIYTHA